MALLNARWSEFDPNKLEAVSEAETIDTGMPMQGSGGDADYGGQNNLRYTSQDFKAPDGTVYKRMEGTDGSVFFMTANPDGQMTRIQPGGGDGKKWVEGEWKDEGFLKTVLGDERLMAFVAIATAGAAASAYAGGGAMASGAVAEGTLPASAAAGGGGAAAAGAGGMSASEIAALEAGDVAIGGGGVASNTVGATAGSTAAASVPQAVSPASSYFDKLLNFGKTAGGGQILGGIVGGIGQSMMRAEDREFVAGENQKNRDHEATQAQVAREWKARNFGADKVTQIDWKTPYAPTEAMKAPSIAPLTTQDPTAKKSMGAGIIERARRGQR